MSNRLEEWVENARSCGICTTLVSYLRWKPQVFYRDDWYDIVTALESLSRYRFMTQHESREFFLTVLTDYVLFAEVFDAIPSPEETQE